MPELPEVQTVINNLKKNVLNSKIDNISIYYPKLLKNSTESEFKNFLNNETIINITRQAKFIIFHFTNNKNLVVHLRMEGKLFFEPFSIPPTHPQLLVEFKLSNGLLRYYDTRKFGTFDILFNYDLINFSPLSKLGPDANQENIDIIDTYNKIKNKNISIKTLLLDQSIIGGIGNIYANEILFASKINPNSKGKEISLQQWGIILENAKTILNNSIKHNGTTIHSFKFDTDFSGGYQEFLLVHGKKKELCKICNSPIKYEKINGRGTYYCKKCQK